MSVVEREQESPATGIKINDVYYVLFRRKWMIISFSLLGVLAAGVLFFALPRLYKSQAKVLIRYIVERKSMTSPEGEGQVKSLSSRGDSVLNSELQILNSFDLIQQVAETVGPARILGGATVENPSLRAAGVIAKGLRTEVLKNSDIIQIEFIHPDQQIVQLVVSELVKNYQEKHIQIHRELGTADEFLRQQTDLLRQRLSGTEQQLRDLKSKHGIISVEETKQAFIKEISSIRQELFSTEAEMEQRKAALGGLPKEVSGDDQAAQTEIAEELLAEYLNHSAQLNSLLQRETELLTKYTDQNPEVVRYQQLIKEKRKLLKEMETTTPQLASLGAAPGRTNGPVNIALETVNISALAAKIRILTNQLAKVQADAAELDAAGSEILELQRKKDVDEAMYKFYSAALDQARVDQAVGPGKAPNINVVQEPTPAIRESSERKKMMAIALAAGVFAGIGLAFLLELFLDPSIKRPGEFESKLDLPLFMTIPKANPKDFKKVAKTGSETGPSALESGLETTISYGDVAWKNGENEVAPWDPKHPLRAYFEALRDRLIADFELKNMTHKPKLVAVTGCSKGAGVSTLATGLAASLSETGGGNVLLVDMNSEQGAAHEIHKGKPGGCGLPDALENDKRNAALVQENFYVASASQPDDRLPRVLPRRFTHLVPKMKASDYDYIIFDMPTVSQTSVTARLAGFMDIVLLVVESEKTHRGLAKKANSLLAQSNAKVSSVLNQYQKYVPSILDQEF